MIIGNSKKGGDIMLDEVPKEILEENQEVLGENIGQGLED